MKTQQDETWVIALSVLLLLLSGTGRGTAWNDERSSAERSAGCQQTDPET